LTSQVVAYVTSWCPDCHRSQRLLDRLRIPYEAIDIETTAGAEEAMRASNGGLGKVPTILIGGSVLVEPSDEELTTALRNWRGQEPATRPVS
jgi:mycoredoxin